MKHTKCVSCGGVYDNVQPDGSSYAHVCPPTIAPVDVRNENPPSTEAKSALKVIAVGKGTQLV